MSSNLENTMFWKEEPLSPNGTSPSDSGEEWLFFDEKPVALGADGEEFTFYDDEQLTRSQVVSKFLEELDSPDWIKEESFADWLEEKIALPIFEELPVPECGQNRVTFYPPLNKPAPQIVPQLVAQHAVVVGQPQSSAQALAQQSQQQHHHHNHHHPGIDATQSLLREFESVLGDVEACHQIGVGSNLTPPQSPQPKLQQQLLVTLQPLYQSQQAQFYCDQAHRTQQPVNEPIAVTEATRQQHNYQDSIVLTTATHQQPHQQRHEIAPQYNIQSLPPTSTNSPPYVPQSQLTDQWSAENLSLESLITQSPNNSVVQELASGASTSSPSDASSSPGSPCTSSNASFISSEDSSDPDWSFESAPSTSRGRPARTARRTSNKPYSRPNVEDKRSRKKEQNKNAATRYRQKKKQEVKLILGEEHELEEQNKKLHGQVEDLQREIGYLKSLMRDLLKVKGLIN